MVVVAWLAAKKSFFFFHEIILNGEKINIYQTPISLLRRCVAHVIVVAAGWQCARLKAAGDHKNCGNSMYIMRVPTPIDKFVL